MAQIIEETVKALTEFESRLDQIHSDALEREKRLAKEAADLSYTAKAEAMAKAKQVADQTVDAASAEAEKAASAVREKGMESLQSFEASISKKKGSAASMVVAKLLGSRS